MARQTTSPSTGAHDEDAIKRLVRAPRRRRGVLSFRDVTRRYGAARALDGVSFALEPGTLTVLAGENGAGKSTALRLAALLEAPTSGVVAGVGRRDLAWLGQEPGLYDDLTVRENLAFSARFFGRADEVDPAAGAF